MSSYMEPYEWKNVSKATHHRYTGNSVDISQVDCQVAEVRADVILEGSEYNGNNVRLWGQIKDCENRGVPYALLKLVRVYCHHQKMQYEGIAHTVSDCDGFYQFDLCSYEGDEMYKILVSKVQTGEELVIHPTCSSKPRCEVQPMCPPEPRHEGRQVCPPEPRHEGRPMCPPEPRHEGRPMCPPEPRHEGRPMCPPEPMYEEQMQPHYPPPRYIQQAQCEVQPTYVETRVYPGPRPCPSHSPYPQQIEAFEEPCSAEVPCVQQSGQVFYAPNYYDDF